jgi:nitroreductase
MTVLQAIQSRQSIREYDPSFKVSQDDIVTLLTEAGRAPSSWNLQPWRFVVIQDEAIKLSLKPHVYFNVPQLETSSFLVLILNDLQRYDLFPILNDLELKAGYVTPEQAAVRQEKANQSKATRTVESLDREGLLDCGIVAQNLMLAAKGHGLDSCPMGGFNRDAFMDILQLDTKRYKPVVLISIGKAKGDLRPSLRFPTEAITIFK